MCEAMAEALAEESDMSVFTVRLDYGVIHANVSKEEKKLLVSEFGGKVLKEEKRIAKTTDQ